MKTSCLWALFLFVWQTGGRLAADEVAAGPARWPQFRGPAGQGIGGPGLRLPVKFGPDERVLWKTALPAGHSSPCIWDDRIYLTAFDRKTRKLETICLERARGKVLWRKAAPAQKIENVHQINTPASSTPACDGERVYVYFGSFGLLCYDKEGTLKWQRPLDPVPTFFGSGTSPIVAGNLVLLNSGTRLMLSLLALDCRTGKTVWQKDRLRGGATGLWSTPVVHRGKDGDEVIVAGGMHVAAYRLKDGKPRWRFGGLPAISLNTPAVGGGLVFLSLTNPIGDLDENIVKLPAFDELIKKHDKNKDGKLSADEIPDNLFLFTRNRADKVGDWLKVRDIVPRVDKNKDKALDREEWQAIRDTINGFASKMEIAVAAIRLDGTGDVSKTHLAWKEPKQVPEVPSPLYYRGRLYLITEKGIISCRDAKSGKEIYRARLGGRGTCYSSPVVGDDKIYAGSDGGVLVVFKPGDRFEVLAQNDFGEGLLATPALVDNRIYVRTERHLYAFGE